ncbi:MAG: TSUP family transporter [Pseudomonadota bacterium]
MTLLFAPEELAWIAAAMLAAGFVKGVTGLGFSTACLPLLALVLGLKASLPLVLAPVGVGLGVAMLGRVEGDLAGAALGAALVAWCAFALARPDWRLGARWARPLAPGVGLATGVVNGLTGSQVLPVTPYLLSLGLERGLFLMTLNLSFTLSSLAMAAGLAGIGLLTAGAGAVSVAGIAAGVGGVALGARWRRRLPERGFRLAVLAALAAAGLALILRGVG